MRMRPSAQAGGVWDGLRWSDWIVSMRDEEVQTGKGSRGRSLY